MGSDIKDWAAVEGAYYTGYGTGEWLWLLVAMAICVVALVMGAMHEKSSYQKLKK